MNRLAILLAFVSMLLFMGMAAHTRGCAKANVSADICNTDTHSVSVGAGSVDPLGNGVVKASGCFVQLDHKGNAPVAMNWVLWRDRNGNGEYDPEIDDLLNKGEVPYVWWYRWDHGDLVINGPNDPIFLQTEVDDGNDTFSMTTRVSGLFY